MIQHWMECFRQKQMKLHELIQPCWEDVPNYSRERDKIYGTAKLKVAAVIQPQTDDGTAIPSPTTFGEPMETLDSITSESRMPQVASRPGSCHMRLRSGTATHINAFRLSSMMLHALFHQLTSRSLLNPSASYPCIYRPKLITIVTSDFHKEMVATPASPEDQIVQLQLLTINLLEYQSVYRLC